MPERIPPIFRLARVTHRPTLEHFSLVSLAEPCGRWAGVVQGGYQMA